MSEKLRYITDEQGERVGVLLDLEEYRQLARQPVPDPDILVGLSRPELQALVENILVSSPYVRVGAGLAPAPGRPQGCAPTF